MVFNNRGFVFNYILINELLDDDYIYNASINNYPDDDNKEKNEKNQ